MDMREECTHIGKRRRRGSKTKASKTVTWSGLASTTSPKIFQKNETVVKKYGFFLVNVK